MNLPVCVAQKQRLCPSWRVKAGTCCARTVPGVLEGQTLVGSSMANRVPVRGQKPLTSSWMREHRSERETAPTPPPTSVASTTKLSISGRRQIWTRWVPKYLTEFILFQTHIVENPVFFILFWHKHISKYLVDFYTMVLLWCTIMFIKQKKPLHVLEQLVTETYGDGKCCWWK